MAKLVNAADLKSERIFPLPHSIYKRPLVQQPEAFSMVGAD